MKMLLTLGMVTLLLGGCMAGNFKLPRINEGMSVEQAKAAMKGTWPPAVPYSVSQYGDDGIIYGYKQQLSTSPIKHMTYFTAVDGKVTNVYYTSN